MGYKQSPFPMHQGTANHTSALKQFKGTDKSDYLEEEINKIEKNKVTKKDTKKDKVTKKDLEAIKLAPNPSDRFTPANLEDKLEKVTAPEYESKSLKQTEKDAKKAFKKEGRKTRKAERKTAKHERKLSRANETVAERKKRRKENYGSLYDDLDPIWRAMDQPRSTTAKGYFDDVYKEEERQAEKDKRDTARAENKTLKKQNKKFMKLINEYEKAESDNVTGKDKTE